MLGAGAYVGEAWIIFHQGGAADDFAEVLPLLVGVDDRADVAVGRTERPALIGKLALVARRPKRRFKGEAAHVVGEDGLGHRLEHRDFDDGALTRLRPAKEGG